MKNGLKKRTAATTTECDPVSPGAASQDNPDIPASAPPTSVENVGKQGNEVRVLVTPPNGANALVKRSADGSGSTAVVPVTQKSDASAKPLEQLLLKQIEKAQKAYDLCLNHAFETPLTPKERETLLKHAESLMKIVVDTSLAVNKIMNGGQQRITVDHMNFHPGSGAVIANSIQPGPARSPQKALTDE